MKKVIEGGRQHESISWFQRGVIELNPAKLTAKGEERLDKAEQQAAAMQE